MPAFRIALITACLVLSAVPMHARQAAAPPQAPTVVFRFSWDKGIPWSDYVFSVTEDGATHFKGTISAAENGSSETVDQDFRMSEANVQKVFQWAKATDYFQGQFESKTKNVAKSGTKTLEFHSSSMDTSATYNFSPNPNIQQLTRLFLAMAVTIEYGRKLSYQYRFDKLGMDTRLKELVDLRASGMADELQAIEPILRQIADDDGVMHVARAEAKQLLKSASPVTAVPRPDSSQP
jgi:hypothetical protein